MNDEPGRGQGDHHHSNGQCWSATFDSFKKQKHDRLKAIGGQ